MTGQQAEIDRTVSGFDRTGQAGAHRPTEGGCPFGFDIGAALMVDDLIRGLGCNAVAETECFARDTTFYLARHYLGLSARIPSWLFRRRAPEVRDGPLSPLIAVGEPGCAGERGPA
jgi:hypothetical protein